MTQFWQKNLNKFINTYVKKLWEAKLKVWILPIYNKICWFLSAGEKPPYNLLVKIVSFFLTIIFVFTSLTLFLFLFFLLIYYLPEFLNWLFDSEFKSRSEVLSYILKPADNYTIRNWHKKIYIEGVVGAAMLLWFLGVVVQFLFSFFGKENEHFSEKLIQVNGICLIFFSCYVYFKCWRWGDIKLVDIDIEFTPENTALIILVQGYLLLKEFLIFIVNSWKFFLLLLLIFILIFRLFDLMKRILTAKSQRLNLPCREAEPPLKVFLKYSFYFWNKSVCLTITDILSMKSYWKPFFILFLIFIYSLYVWSIKVAILLIFLLTLLYEFKCDHQEHKRDLAFEPNRYGEDDKYKFRSMITIWLAVIGMLTFTFCVFFLKAYFSTKWRL